MPSLSAIPEAFRAAVRRFSASPLVVTAEASHSFAEIDVASDRIAAGLGRHNIGVGDRVALYCPNVPEFLVAYLGVVKAGAIVVPINLLIQADEARFILDDAAVRGVIYHNALHDKVDTLRQQAKSDLCWVRIGGADDRSGDISFSSLLTNDAPTPAPMIDPAKDLAAILYTSGTTGRSKGVMLTHLNLVSNTHSVCTALSLRPGEDRLLVVLPMFHSFAATVGMLTPALHGLSFVPVVRFDTSLVSETIAKTGATLFLGVPSMYSLLVRLDDRQAALWRGIRFGVAGGAAMPPDLLVAVEERLGFPVLEGDGPTECSPVTCVNPIDGARKPGSVGLPVPGVEMGVRDDAGEVMPRGEVGEVCVRGPNVMLGYWQQPTATAETMVGDWLRTGDLGYIDDDGYIFLVDRKKDMVIVNGMNVYPRMVEEVISSHPDVAEVAVVGEPHRLHGEIIVAWVVTKAGAELSDAALKAFCRDRLGPHQLPRRFERSDGLPKNATGKVLKRELRRAGELERGVDQPT